MPAKAGIQNHLKILDSRLRGNDAKGDFKTFYETINNVFWLFFERLSEANPPFDIRHSIFDTAELVAGCGSLLL
jgi:hypothetical protein